MERGRALASDGNTPDFGGGVGSAVGLRLQADVASNEDKRELKARIKKAEESVEAMKIARKSMVKFMSSFETGLTL